MSSHPHLAVVRLPQRRRPEHAGPPRQRQDEDHERVRQHDRELVRKVDPAHLDRELEGLREAEEEVGLPADHVSVIGRLDTYVTGTGYEITPVVGLVRAPYPMRVDPHEVADVFEVPLAFVLDPRNHERRSREVKGRTRNYYVLPFPGRFIWGATAGMLVNLAEVLS